MTENLHNTVDERFRDSLQQHKTNPSENVWNRIEDELEKEEKRISIFGSPRIATMALCLIIFSGIFIYIYQSNNQVKSPIDESLQQISGKYKKTLHSPVSLITKPESVHWPKNNILFQKAAVENADMISVGDFSGTVNLHFVPIAEFETEMSTFYLDKDKKPDAIVIEEDLLIHHDKQRLGDRLSITPYFSHEFAGYNPVDDDARGPNGKEMDVQQRNAFSASAGVYFNFKVNKKWVIQSGVSYSWANSYIDSSKSYAVKDYNGDIQFKLNTSTGYGYLKPSSVIPPNVGDSILTAKTYSKLHYLTIPLILSYNISMKRFSLLVGGGVTLNIKTSGTLETRTYGPGYPEKEYNVNILGLKKTNFGMILKADLEYQVNSRFGIDLIPSFKNTLGPINLPGALSAFPYNFGIGLGVSYRF
jgi:Outer membrane protein beta-barrel domain